MHQLHMLSLIAKYSPPIIDLWWWPMLIITNVLSNKTFQVGSSVSISWNKIYQYQLLTVLALQITCKHILLVYKWDQPMILIGRVEEVIKLNANRCFLIRIKLFEKNTPYRIILIKMIFHWKLQFGCKFDDIDSIVCTNLICWFCVRCHL